MTVPTYDKFMEPILRYLASCPDGARVREVYEAAANALNISEETRQEILPSGFAPVYKHRAWWAHDRLKRAGLSSKPRRGIWRLTEAGIEYARSHPSRLIGELGESPDTALQVGTFVKSLVDATKGK